METSAVRNVLKQIVFFSRFLLFCGPNIRYANYWLVVIGFVVAVKQNLFLYKIRIDMHMDMCDMINVNGKIFIRIFVQRFAVLK